MTPAMTPLVLLALLPLAFWLALTLDRRRAWPWEHVLDPGAVLESPAGSVTVVVPARDEAEVLPETLPALLSQQVLQQVPGTPRQVPGTPRRQLPGTPQEAPGAELRVVLVDDGSTDGTAEVAQQVAQQVADGRGLAECLQVLRATPTPEGWTGKVHALACGVEACGVERVASEWLLFTDADIRHRPGSLTALLAKAQEGPYDLVSVMARLHAETFWERLLIPPFVFYFQLLYPFRQVASPRSKVAAAAGGCVLVRRTVLEAAGGVASIRDAVIDDVSLAKRVAEAGGRTWLGLDPGIVSVRPYRGLGELWQMVARSAFVQLRHRWDLLAAVLVGLALFVVSPPFVAAVAVWDLAHTAGIWGSAALALAAAVGAWVLEARALWPAVRHHRVSGLWAWTLPFASILYGLMTASSAWSHLIGRGARWKGRAYR